MGKSVDICISDLDSAITQLNSEIETVNDTLSDIRKLSFGEKCPKSSGSCARSMCALTEVQMVKMASMLINLMQTSVELLDDAKEKYTFMDNSIAEELEKK